MMFIALQFCEPPFFFSPSIGQCIQCPQTSIQATTESPSLYCGCPSQILYDSISFTCPAAATCTTNQPFPGDCVGAGILQSKCEDGQSVVFNPAGVCGTLVYTEALETPQAQTAPCVAPLVYSTTLQSCVVVVPPSIFTVNGSNNFSLHIAQSTQVCSTKGNLQACESLWNFCSLPFIDTLQLCAVVQQIAGIDIDVFQDVNPSLARTINKTINSTFLPNVKKNIYLPYNGTIQKGWENIMNLTAVFTDIYGNILLKTKLDLETLDMCNILEAGLNPLTQKIRHYADINQRDRRLNFGDISRSLFHKSTEMIKRNSDPTIILENKEYPSLQFGNNYNKVCRVGYTVLQKLSEQNLPIFVSIYGGNTNNTSHRLLVNTEDRSSLSFPLFYDDIFASTIQISVLSAKNNESFYPIVNIFYQNITKDVLTGPLLNRVVTKFTQAETKRNFNSETNFIDFNLQIRFKSENEFTISTRSIINIILFWFVFLFYALFQAKKYSGLGRNPFNGAQNGALILLYIFFMMVFGVGFGMLVDILVFQCINFYSPIAIQASPDSTLSFIGTECLVSGILTLISSLYIVFFTYKAKFVILDHGNQAAYRRVFITNALLKLINYNFLSITFAFSLAFFLLFGLDFQYFGAISPTAAISPHNFDINASSTTTAFFVFLSFILSAVLSSIYRCCTISPYDKFIDLISLTNCSVFAFDSEFSGVLIYGKSPFGDTDGEAFQLVDALQREARGLVPRRGINGSGQSFRFYFNSDCEELLELTTLCNLQNQYEMSVSGPVGDQEIDSTASLINKRWNFEIPYFSAEKAQNLLKINAQAVQALQLIHSQPIRYVAKLARIFDMNPQKSAKLLVLSDPTRNLSPRGNDSGARPPGGFGGASWLASCFYYSRWFTDAVLASSLSAAVVQMGNNSALGMCVAWVILGGFSVFWKFSQRKRLGVGSLVGEGLME